MMIRIMTLAILVSFIWNPARASPPNIVVFLVDDMGWQDTSVPFGPEETPFNQRYRTPNMERLAERGMLFTDAYSASPVCTPTRTSIMTGQSPGRSGITYWTLHPDRDTSTEHPRIAAPPWRKEGLQEEDLTLADILGRAGYFTIHVGKAHLGAVGTTGADPKNLGFDLNIAGHGPGGPGSFYGIHDFKARNRQGKAGPSVWDVPDLEDHHGKDVYLTEVLCNEAINAIDVADEMQKPFFLHFAPYAVHAPIMANHRYLTNYPALDKREAAYATMIESMDDALGRILDELDRRGLADDTIVIFTSDNGGLSAHSRGGSAHVHNAPLRSGKGSAYEGGVRVPLIIAWPGVVSEGTRNSTPVISMDLFPTIIEMAETTAPEDIDQHEDGWNLAPILRGVERGEAERRLTWHMPHQWGASGPGIEPFSSIRRGPWKLYYFHDGPRIELYDLSRDPGETAEIAATNPKISEALLMDLDAWFRDTGAEMSIDRNRNQPVMMPGVASRSIDQLTRKVGGETQ